jgi:ferric enterobactin receptor
MTNRVALLFCIFLSTWITIPFDLSAQMPFNLGQGNVLKGHISGSVVDSSSGLSVEFAAVSIRKKGAVKELTGTLTDANGNFRLDEIPIGAYEISISFIGYKEITISDLETTKRKPDLNIGTVKLTPGDYLLDEVVIAGEASLIESKVDRLVYNAEKDISISGGDASDVLRKVPMLSVDIEGNPSLRGSANVRVLINGKPSGTMAGNIADALKMIPADEIKSIEVITSPSAKYDAEGTGGIINIITKKRNIEGISGSVNGGINSRNGMMFGNGGWKKRRLSINSSLGANFFIPQGGFTKFEREDEIDAGTRILTQDGAFIGGRNTYNGSVNVDYDFNAYHNVSSNFRISNFSFQGDNDVDVFFFDPVFDLMQNYTRSAVNRNGNTTFDWSADYRRTYTKPGKEFSISSQISRNNSISRYNLDQGNPLFPELLIQERSFNNGGNLESTFQTDYVHPFIKGNFETGAKAILRNIDSDFLYEVRDFVTGDYIEDPSRGNTFDYQQNVYAAYVSYNHNITDNWETKAGLRYEYTDMGGSFTGGETTVSNQFGNFVPSFTLARKLKNFRSVKFNYSRRIQRPSLFFLNPFVDESDPRNIRAGNPNLEAEVSDLLEVGYNGFFKGTVINAAIYYRNTRDVIQAYIEVREDGVSFNSFDNIGVNNNYGVNLFGQIKMMNFWTIRGSVNGFFVQQRGVISGQELTNEDIQYNIMLSTTFDLKNDWAAEAFGLFNSQRVTLQGRLPAFSIYNFSVKKSFWNKKASLGLNMTNPFTPFLEFRQDLAGPGFFQSNVNAIPIRAVGINFSYRFGKMEFRDPMQQRGRRARNSDLKEGQGDMNF